MTFACPRSPDALRGELAQPRRRCHAERALAGDDAQLAFVTCFEATDERPAADRGQGVDAGSAGADRQGLHAS